MLNEYLCRNFLADEILSQIQRPLITHKVGRPFSKVADDDQTGPTGDQMADRKSRVDVADIKDNLLSDPGSSNYRDWLSKWAQIKLMSSWNYIIVKKVDVYNAYVKRWSSNSKVKWKYSQRVPTGMSFIQFPPT